MNALALQLEAYKFVEGSTYRLTMDGGDIIDAKFGSRRPG